MNESDNIDKDITSQLNQLSTSQLVEYGTQILEFEDVDKLVYAKSWSSKSDNFYTPREPKQRHVSINEIEPVTPVFYSPVNDYDYYSMPRSDIKSIKESKSTHKLKDVFMTPINNEITNDYEINSNKNLKLKVINDRLESLQSNKSRNKFEKIIEDKYHSEEERQDRMKTIDNNIMTVKQYKKDREKMVDEYISKNSSDLSGSKVYSSNNSGKKSSYKRGNQSQDLITMTNNTTNNKKINNKLNMIQFNNYVSRLNLNKNKNMDNNKERKSLSKDNSRESSVNSLKSLGVKPKLEQQPRHKSINIEKKNIKSKLNNINNNKINKKVKEDKIVINSNKTQKNNKNLMDKINTLSSNDVTLDMDESSFKNNLDLIKEDDEYEYSPKDKEINDSQAMKFQYETNHPSNSPPKKHSTSTSKSLCAKIRQLCNNYKTDSTKVSTNKSSKSKMQLNLENSSNYKQNSHEKYINKKKEFTEAKDLLQDFNNHIKDQSEKPIDQNNGGPIVVHLNLNDIPEDTHRSSLFDKYSQRSNRSNLTSQLRKMRPLDSPRLGLESNSLTIEASTGAKNKVDLKSLFSNRNNYDYKYQSDEVINNKPRNNTYAYYNCKMKPSISLTNSAITIKSKNSNYSELESDKLHSNDSNTSGNTNHAINNDQTHQVSISDLYAKMQQFESENNSLKQELAVMKSLISKPKSTKSSEDIQSKPEVDVDEFYNEIEYIEDVMNKSVTRIDKALNKSTNSIKNYSFTNINIEDTFAQKSENNNSLHSNHSIEIIQTGNVMELESSKGEGYTEDRADINNLSRKVEKSSSSSDTLNNLSDSTEKKRSSPIISSGSTSKKSSKMSLKERLLSDSNKEKLKTRAKYCSFLETNDDELNEEAVFNRVLLSPKSPQFPTYAKKYDNLSNGTKSTLLKNRNANKMSFSFNKNTNSNSNNTIQSSNTNKYSNRVREKVTIRRYKYDSESKDSLGSYVLSSTNSRDTQSKKFNFEDIKVRYNSDVNKNAFDNKYMEMRYRRKLSKQIYDSSNSNNNAESEVM